jgi:hypothetical protein
MVNVGAQEFTITTQDASFASVEDCPCAVNLEAQIVLVLWNVCFASRRQHNFIWSSIGFRRHRWVSCTAAVAIQELCIGKLSHRTTGGFEEEEEITSVRVTH